MISQDLFSLFNTEFPAILFEGFSDVFRCDKFWIVSVKVLEQGVKLLFGEHWARADSGRQELWVVDLSVAIIVNVLHDRFYLRVGQTQICIIRVSLLELCQRNHTGSVNIYFLEGFL